MILRDSSLIGELFFVDDLLNRGVFPTGGALSEEEFPSASLLVGSVFSILSADTLSIEADFSVEEVSIGAEYSNDALLTADIFAVVASTKQPAAGVLLYFTHK